MYLCLSFRDRRRQQVRTHGNNHGKYVLTDLVRIYSEYVITFFWFQKKESLDRLGSTMIRSTLVAALCSIAMGANSDFCITPDKYNPDADVDGTTCDASITKLIGSEKMLGGKLPTSEMECKADWRVTQTMIFHGHDKCCRGGTFCDQYAPNPCLGNRYMNQYI